MQQRRNWVEKTTRFYLVFSAFGERCAFKNPKGFIPIHHSSVVFGRFNTFFKVIHHLVPPPIFLRTIFSMKLPTDQENSNYFMRSGNTALSQ